MRCAHFLLTPSSTFHPSIPCGVPWEADLWCRTFCFVVSGCVYRIEFPAWDQEAEAKGGHGTYYFSFFPFGSLWVGCIPYSKTTAPVYLVFSNSLCLWVLVTVSSSYLLGIGVVKSSAVASSGVLWPPAKSPFINLSSNTVLECAVFLANTHTKQGIFCYHRHIWLIRHGEVK